MPSRSVIIDTNFFLLPFQFKINIMRELEFLLDFSHSFVISSKTISELQKLSASVGKHGAAARVGIKILEANKDNIKIIKDDRHVDDWIVDYATENNAIVCTNDSKLRRRLKAARVKVITMKSKSKLGYI